MILNYCLPEKQRDSDEGRHVAHAGGPAAERVHCEGHGLEGHVQDQHHRVLRPALKCYIFLSDYSFLDLALGTYRVEQKISC